MSIARGVEVRIAGRRFQVIKVGATVDGQRDMVLLVNTRDSGDLRALHVDEVQALLEPPKPPEGAKPLEGPKPLVLGEGQSGAPDTWRWAVVAVRVVLIAELLAVVAVIVGFSLLVS